MISLPLRLVQPSWSLAALPPSCGAVESLVADELGCRAAFAAAFRAALASYRARASAHRSSSVGTGLRSSMGTCAGAMMCLTTWRLLLDVLHPGVMATTSPVRSELLGSCTRCC